MGHILIDHVSTEYINRRHQQRPSDPFKIGQPIPVLYEIDLEFFDGEMVCILGPPGCGKSTLLHMIAGFEPITKGRILIDRVVAIFKWLI